MQKSNQVYLLEIIRLILNIRKFVGKKNRETVIKNHQLCSAILLQLMILGEQSKKITSEIKSKIDLPWKNIAGFRDVAVHDYGKIDNEIVVGIVFDRLDDVEGKIKEYLRTHSML